MFTQLLGVRVGNGEDPVAHPTFADLRVAALPVFPCFSLFFPVFPAFIRWGYGSRARTKKPAAVFARALMRSFGECSCLKDSRYVSQAICDMPWARQTPSRIAGAGVAGKPQAAAIRGGTAITN